MKKRLAGLLALCLMIGLFSGCAEKNVETAPTTIETTVATEPPVVYGDPDRVTYKSRYTGEPDMNQVVAQTGDAALTNGELQVWYWAAVAAFRNGDAEQKPNFQEPLEYQACPLDDNVDNWQQYFLKKALDNWHGVQALMARSKTEPLPVEETFAPDEKNREKYFVDIPAGEFLYREEKFFKPNTMHQEYLDGIPENLNVIAERFGYTDAAQMAEAAFGTNLDALETMVYQYNLAYMYATECSYFTETTEEEVVQWFAEHADAYENQGIHADTGRYVDFRHILLVPEKDPELPELTVQVGEDGTVTCAEALWLSCEKEASALVGKWRKGSRGGQELSFANLAHSDSKDAGTAPDGGAFRHVAKGQMIDPIDSWCFDQARQTGDYTVLRTEYGVHILYYIGGVDIWEAHSEEDLKAYKLRQILEKAREQCPVEITYEAITLASADAVVDMDTLLYEDLAHERYPEIPLYLQQDYPQVSYGQYPLRTHGCGIVSMAMLTSYMMDEEWTPPELAKRYGHYNTLHGTDVTLFIYEPAALGYYSQQTYDAKEAYAALEEGYPVISVQTQGYWTGGGHYIVLEKLNEDGTIQVRDSNLFNYGKLKGHKEDKHTWNSITRSGKNFWIISKKLTHLPLCSRCGDCPEVTNQLMQENPYLCQRCRPALLRRNTFLSAMG